MNSIHKTLESLPEIISKVDSIKIVNSLKLKAMVFQAITVTEIPKTNIGIIRYNNRVMVWQNLIEQYCYLPGF